LNGINNMEQEKFKFIIKVAKEEEQIKIIDIIDKMLAERLNGERYNFFINGEELKTRIKGEK